MPSSVLTERTAAAWVDRRSAACFHHALLLQRAEQRAWDDPAADLLPSLLGALAELQLDDEARALGLRADHIAEIRFALVALLDECAAHQPGSEPWRERLFVRAGLPRSANVGQEFFVALERRLGLPAPSPADLAVLQIDAVCLFLGLRGRYGADVAAAESDLEHQLRRLQLKLRPLLAPRLPPATPPPPLLAVSRPSRTSLRVAGLLLVFTIAAIAGLRARLAHHADTVRAHLTASLP